MIDFINRQISNGQQQFDARQAAEEDKMRKDAFDEAIRFVWDYSIHFYFWSVELKIFVSSFEFYCGQKFN